MKAKLLWIKIVGWGVALLLLLGTVVYFNVFAPQNAVALIHIGMECPDFTLEQYSGSDFGLHGETFTLSEQRGSVVVINFWATWCGPCVAEIPYFNTVANEFPEVKIVAIHEDSTESVPRFIVRATDSKESWRNYKLTFLQDEMEGTLGKTFQILGGNAALPVTLIVDSEGRVTFIQQGRLSYDKLKQEVQKALEH